MLRAILLTAMLLLLAGCKDGIESPAQPEVSSVRVVAFTASWCGPCQRDKSTLARAQGYGAEVTIVDIDKYPNVTAEFRVRSVPTYFIYVGGSVQVTHDVSDVLAAVFDRVLAVKPKTKVGRAFVAPKLADDALAAATERYGNGH